MKSKNRDKKKMKSPAYGANPGNRTRVKKTSRVDIVRSSTRNLRKMLRIIPQSQHYLTSKVVANCLSKLSSEPWIRFFSGKKSSFKYYDMESVVSAFYEELSDTYIGIDSILPSNFIKWVHPYLLSSLTSRKGNVPSAKYCHGRHLVRILTIDREKLQNDYKDFPHEWNDYLRYHEKELRQGGPITLLSVTPDEAKKAKKAHDIWTTDLGLWPRNCALMFDPEISRENEIAIQLVNPFEQEPLFQRCINYTKALISKAKRLRWRYGAIRPEPVEPELKEDLLWQLEGLTGLRPELVEAWSKFVSPCRRMKSKEGNFLIKNVLNRYKNPDILDAASGVGAETIWLKNKGYNVTANEIIWGFIEDAQKLAKRVLRKLPKKKRNYPMWLYDWRHLNSKVPANSFDVVLVLGNSLTCLLDREEMKRCLVGFHHVLRPDGLLVIDTRNYKAMFDNPDSMKADFRFRQEVVYVSKVIRARPGKQDRLGLPMELAYCNNGAGGEIIGTWTVYAYKEGEMRKLLVDDNLFTVSDEDVFWDFEKDPNRKMLAEFITYIAHVRK